MIEPSIRGKGNPIRLVIHFLLWEIAYSEPRKGGSWILAGVTTTMARGGRGGVGRTRLAHYEVSSASFNVPFGLSGFGPGRRGWPRSPVAGRQADGMTPST